MNCINGPLCGYPGRCPYGCHRVEPKRVNCISHTGACPIAAGECDRDGECYLWRCEHPHAPKPECDEVAEFAELLLRMNAARMVA